METGLDREDKLLYEGRFLSLKQRGHWEFVARRFDAKGVMVVALTPDERLLLVEEDRPPVGGRVVSLPAGLVGDDGTAEEPRVAAERELREETGYEAAAPVAFLGEGPSSPGLASESVAFFLARGVRRVPGAKTEEGIEVHAVALSEVRAWTRARQRLGVQVHPLLWAALYLAEL